MRRETVYPGQVLPETALLNMGRDMMIGMGKLMQDILGAGPAVSGFACTPTAPASLQVNIAPGNIYAMQPLEASPWSTLPADVSHTIVKQGVLSDPVSLTLTPPAATGQAINYLVQVAYQDQDINPVVLPYYNSLNPSQPFTGQGNNGQSQATARDGVAVVSLKAGIAAPSGNQQTPAPDTGNVGLWVITVLNGQTTVTAQNIAAAPGAPYINPTMLGLSPNLIQSPAQFDKSTKLATTEFVQRALGSASGVMYVSEATTLNAVAAGQCIDCFGGSYDITLPPTSAVKDGVAIEFFYSGSGAVTVRVAGTDKLTAGLVNVPLLTLLPGDTARLLRMGSAWTVVSGSIALALAPQFAAGSGYQYCPPNSLECWGTVLTGAAGTPLVVTYPQGFLIGSQPVVTLGVTDDRSTSRAVYIYNDTATGFSLISNLPNTRVFWRARGVFK